jgi:hypothetical protein
MPCHHQERWVSVLYVCVCIYIYVCVCVCVCTFYVCLCKDMLAKICPAASNSYLHMHVLFKTYPEQSSLILVANVSDKGPQVAKCGLKSTQPHIQAYTYIIDATTLIATRVSAKELEADKPSAHTRLLVTLLNTIELHCSIYVYTSIYIHRQHQALSHQRAHTHTHISYTHVG